MRLLKSISVCVGLVVAGPALAADPVIYLETPKDLFDWSGFYVGAEVGGAVGGLSGNGDELPFSGPVFDIVAGYNMESGPMLYGVEADIGLGAVSGATPCPGSPRWTCNSDFDFHGSVRGRVGLLSDDMLFYVTGGLAVANVGGSLVSPSNFEYTDSDVRFGYTIGGGIETALSDTLTGRIQYQYANYGERDMTFNGVYPDILAESHTIKLGLMSHFN